MIEKLGYSGRGIFETELSDDKRTLSIIEACDFYFSAKMSKADVIELANDFLKIAEQMVDAEIGEHIATERKS